MLKRCSNCINFIAEDIPPKSGYCKLNMDNVSGLNICENFEKTYYDRKCSNCINNINSICNKKLKPPASLCKGYRLYDKLYYSVILGIYSYSNLVYVCAPYSGDVDKNINKVIEYANGIYEIGQIPITPHLLFPFIKNEDKKEYRDGALSADINILAKCDYIFVFGDINTNGMLKEINYARNNNIKIKYIRGV